MGKKKTFILFSPHVQYLLGAQGFPQLLAPPETGIICSVIRGLGYLITRATDGTYRTSWFSIIPVSTWVALLTLRTIVINQYELSDVQTTNKSWQKIHTPCQVIRECVMHIEHE